MASHAIAQTSARRRALSRHPVAVECARAAGEMVGASAEVVIFEDGRGFIVASSTSTVMQPRHLVPTERLLIQAGHGDDDSSEAPTDATSDLTTDVELATGWSTPIVDETGEVVGALTVGGRTTAQHRAALGSLGRIVSLAGVSATADHEANDLRGAAILDGLRDAVLVLDDAMVIIWVNHASGSLIGRSPAELVGRSAVDFLHPDDIESTLHTLVRVKAGLEVYRVNVRLLRPEGGYESVEVTGIDHSDNPAIGGVVLSLRSADAVNEMERTTERSDRLAEAIVTGLHDGLVATDQFGAVTVVNDVAREMFGLDPTLPDASVRLADLRVVDDDGVPIDLESDQRLTFESSFELGLRVDADPCPPRHLTIKRQSVLDRDREMLGSILVFHDVTQIKEAAALLRHQAMHDQLTGLPNRRQLEERLDDLDGQVGVAACFIDLDGFKLINDNYGHSVGDQLIRIAAGRLEQVLRRSDLLVRQGGDEFVALHVGTSDQDEVMAVADRLRAVLGQPFTIDGRRFDVTASVGVAIAGPGEVDLERLMRQSDIALYAAKTRGRNRVELFDQALADAVEVEAAQQKFVRDALREDRLVMYFQPLIHASDEHICGYEALARIRTVEGEIVGPDTFLADHLPADLMYALDSEAFEQSCAAVIEMARSTPDSPPYVACNLSATTLSHPDLVAMIVDTADRHSVPPSQICLEVTESAAFSSGPVAAESLTVLHGLGFRIALDDFGTGYSSLVHLRDLPIDVVKVDRSFVSRLADHGSERAIVTAITALARNLGLGVVAEGVETLSDLDHAQAMGFDTLQGWYYAKAMPLGEVLAPHLASVLAVVAAGDAPALAGAAE